MTQATLHLFGTITLTPRNIDEGMDGDLWCNKCQAAVLGVPYPLVFGWKNRLVGKVVSQFDYEVFVALQGQEPDNAIKIMVEAYGEAETKRMHGVNYYMYSR